MDVPPLRILINEDSAADAALVLHELRRVHPDLYHEHVMDRPGFEAAVSAGQWDLVLSDFSLPGFNALEALRITREIDAELPFIVVSGAIGEERAFELMRAGATDFVRKQNLSRVPMVVDRALREAREHTALRAAEQGLIDAAKQWQDTFDAISDIVFMLDESRRVVRMNRSAVRILGLQSRVPENGLTADSILRSLRPESEGISAPSDGEVLSRTEWGPCGDESRWYLLTIDTAKDNAGATIGHVMVLRDITQRKEAEAQQLAMVDRLRLTMMGSVAVAGKMLECRDPYTAGHQQNVADLALAIAKEMALPEIDTEALHTAGLLHDIGKIAVPAEILVKPGALDELEMQIIRRHPEVAAEILSDAQFEGNVVEIARQHHERLDGTGYPDALKGDDICLEARILAVSDVVEAMAAHRPYRPARPIGMAIDELEQGNGVRYDARVVEACLALLKSGAVDGILGRAS